MPLVYVYKIWLRSVNSSWSYHPKPPGFRQIDTFSARVTLKFDGWPWKTIGILSYASRTCVKNLIAIQEF